MGTPIFTPGLTLIGVGAAPLLLWVAPLLVEVVLLLLADTMTTPPAFVDVLIGLVRAKVDAEIPLPVKVVAVVLVLAGKGFFGDFPAIEAGEAGLVVFVIGAPPAWAICAAPCS